MGDTPTNKCPNCGAQVPLINTETSTCSYCGSILTKRVHEEPPVTEPAQPAEPITEQPAEAAQPDEMDAVLRKGCGIFTLILIVVIIIAIAKNAGSSFAYYSGVDSMATADSLKIAEESINAPNLSDSVDAEIETAHGEVSTNGYGRLFKLIDVKVSAKKFSKLNKQARKVDGTYIYDRTSDRKAFSLGCYTYIADDPDPSIFFVIKTPVDKWLSIHSVSFNADGKKLSSYSSDFQKERTGGRNREYTELTMEDGDIPVLLTLARAKSATVVLTGARASKTITITAEQQAAIMRQLMIFKGLILKYDEP